MERRGVLKIATLQVDHFGTPWIAIAISAYWRVRAAMGQFLGTQIVVGFDPSLFLPRSETIGEHLRCQDAAKTRNESASKIDMGMAQIGKLLIN
jgi:hypothetical protein